MKKFLALALAALVAFTPLVAAAGGAGHMYRSKAAVKWVKGITTDSTTVAIPFGTDDTTAAIPLAEHRSEMASRLSATDSTFVLVGELEWSGSTVADSMIVTVQFSQDGALWTTERGYIVINIKDPFPLYRWTNTNADMNQARYVRAIVLHNDGAGGGTGTRTFTLKPVVFTEGAN